MDILELIKSIGFRKYGNFMNMVVPTCDILTAGNNHTLRVSKNRILGIFKEYNLESITIILYIQIVHIKLTRQGNFSKIDLKSLLL